MTKRRIRITALIVAIVTVAAALGVIGISLTVEDSLFYLNTPMKITCNSTVVGTIKEKEDYEAYIFEVEKPGALTVRLNHDNMLDAVKCGYVITLYKILDSDKRIYQEITYFESFWNETTSSWGETGVSAGTYLVVVKPGVDILYGDFTLVTAFTATNAFEKEPNETKETANPVEVGNVFYAASSQRNEGTDIDWFSFEIQYDSCVSLSFIHEDLTAPTAGWNIKLMNENDQVVCDFTSMLTDTNLKTGSLGLKAGKYYIKIEGLTPIGDTYSVHVGSDKAVNHEFELNDTPETATTLPLGIGISGSLAERLLGLDKDYYKFTVPADGIVELYFKHPEIEGDKNGWNIKVLKKDDDGSFYQVVKKISAWNRKALSVYNLGLAAGDYYLLIDGDSMSYNSESYSIQWFFTEKENFEKEPNNIMRRSEAIDFGETYYGALISSDTNFDEDFYKIEITEETTVKLHFGHDKLQETAIAWVASIVDEDNDAICAVDSYLDDSLVSTDEVVLSEGVYYVKIETGMYGSENPYYFTLEKVNEQ